MGRMCHLEYWKIKIKFVRKNCSVVFAKGFEFKVSERSYHEVVMNLER